MKVSNWIVVWGAMDILTIVWGAINSIANSEVPFVTEFTQAIEISRNFGEQSVFYMTILTQIVVLSFLVSGFFMLLRRKIGIIISFAQFPFRLFLVVPPTLFFLPEISSVIHIPSIALILLLASVELFKAATQVLYFRQIRKGIAGN